MKQIVWKKEKSAKVLRPGALTPEEQECVRVAMRVLRVRFGSYAKIARMIGADTRNTARWGHAKGKPDARVALTVARLAGVPVDDVLQGRFPASDSCPFCGHKLIHE
jgi:hypothetical protein